MINILNQPISKFFKLSDAVFLKSWGIYCFPSEEEYKNILKMAAKMDEVKEYFNFANIVIHSWLRPKSYNSYIRGAEKSKHLEGLAVDFSVDGFSPQTVQALLKKRITELGIRLEEDTPTWTHIDLGSVGTFKP